MCCKTFLGGVGKRFVMRWSCVAHPLRTVLKELQRFVNGWENVHNKRGYRTMVGHLIATNPHGHPIQEPRLDQVLYFVIKKNYLDALVGERSQDVVVHRLVHLLVGFQWHMRVSIQLGLKVLRDAKRIQGGARVVPRRIGNDKLGCLYVMQALNQTCIWMYKRLVQLVNCARPGESVNVLQALPDVRLLEKRCCGQQHIVQVKHKAFHGHRRSKR